MSGARMRQTIASAEVDASPRETTVRTHHQCVGCGARRSLYRYRSFVRADANHTLCLRCYRGLRDSMRAFPRPDGVCFPVGCSKGVPVTTTEIAIDAIRGVTFGPETRFQNLTMTPIIRDDDRCPDYVTLDEALGKGWAEITEVNDGGQVSELKIVVKGTAPVLLLDGEELIGAKQNRVLNLTILAPAQRATVIPVSCVESGRWRRMSRSFSSSPRTQFAEGRAAKMRQVTASLSAAGHRASDQHDVWRRIADKSSRLNAMSDTSAMSALFEKVDTGLDEFVCAFTPLERQVGAVFYINDEPVGLELFDASDTWRKLSAKLIRSFAVDAIDRNRRRAATSGTPAPTVFVAAVASSAASAFAAAGEGDDVRFNGSEIAAAALVAHGRVIHLSAFPVGVR